MSNKDVECPYCGAGVEICHDDGQGYAEDEKHQEECETCGKAFVFNTFISFRYRAQKADCLNGGEHQWRETNTIPRCFRRLKCTVCDDEKNIEGIEIERKAYFKSLKKL